MELSLLLAIRDRLSSIAHSAENAAFFFFQPFRHCCGFTCGKLIYFSIFHIFLSPEWNRLFQQDGTSVTNKWVIASLPCSYLWGCSTSFFIKSLIGSSCSGPTSSCISTSVSFALAESHHLLSLLHSKTCNTSLGLSEEIFCVWLTEHSSSFCACPLRLICSASASVADAGYHHLFMLHKINVSLLQEWTVGILWE